MNQTVTTLPAPVIATAAARLAARAALESSVITPTTSRDRSAPAAVPCRACAHCDQIGTTVAGALWRVSLRADDDDLYFLHTSCLAPYKVAHGLRSVEGRIPR